MSVNSLANVIHPWCEIQKGQRWVLAKSKSDVKPWVAVKDKNKIATRSSAVLAKNFEFMHATLSKQLVKNKTYAVEDGIALTNLRKVTTEKYEKYCKSHNILVRILELFLGIFRGYSYRSSYNKLIQTIDKHLLAYEKTPVGVFKSWWDNGFLDHLKPGPVFIAVRVVVDGKPELNKDFKKSCLLGVNYSEDYRKFMQEMLNEISSEFPSEKIELCTEQINFSKDNQDDSKISAVICKENGTIRKSYSDMPTTIYQGWAKKHLSLLELPSGDITDNDNNFVIPEVKPKVNTDDSLEALIKEGRELVEMNTHAPVGIIGNWWKYGFTDNTAPAKPGLVVITVKLMIDGKPRLSKNITKRCLLGVDAQRDYLHFIKKIKTEIFFDLLPQPGMKVEVEQVSFAKDHNDPTKMVETVCNSNGSVQKTLRDFPPAIKGNWDTGELELRDLPPEYVTVDNSQLVNPRNATTSKDFASTEFDLTAEEEAARAKAESEILEAATKANEEAENSEELAKAKKKDEEAKLVADAAQFVPIGKNTEWWKTGFAEIMGKNLKPGSVFLLSQIEVDGKLDLKKDILISGILGANPKDDYLKLFEALRSTIFAHTPFQAGIKISIRQVNFFENGERFEACICDDKGQIKNCPARNSNQIVKWAKHNLKDIGVELPFDSIEEGLNYIKIRDGIKKQIVDTLSMSFTPLTVKAAIAKNCQIFVAVTLNLNGDRSKKIFLCGASYIPRSLDENLLDIKPKKHVLVLVKGKLVKKEVDLSSEFIKKITLQRQGSLVKRTNEIDDKFLKDVKKRAFMMLQERESVDQIKYTVEDAIEVELIIFSHAHKKYRPTICNTEMIKGKMEVNTRPYKESYPAETNPADIFGDDFFGLFPDKIADENGNFIQTT
jgi:hypothetical protein